MAELSDAEIGAALRRRALGEPEPEPVSTAKPLLEQASEAVVGAPAAVGQFVQEFPGRAAAQLQAPEGRRAILTGTGAAAGGLLGLPGGPVGVAAGTALGSLTGGAIANIIDAGQNWLNGTPQTPPVDAAARAVRDASIDTGLTMVFIGANPLARKLAGKLLGLPPGARHAVEEAASVGVGVGTANVATSGAGRTAVNVFARMPLIGTPARDVARQQAIQYAGAFDDLLTRIAPLRETADVGRAAFQHAERTAERFFQTSTTELQAALAAGQRAGPIIETRGIVQAARAAADDIARTAPGVAPLPAQQTVATRITELTNLPPRISTVDARSVDHYIERMLAEARTTTGSTFPQLANVRNQVTAALGNSTHPAAQRLQAWNEFHSAGMRRLESVGSKQFERVEGGMFHRGLNRPGAMSQEELLTAAKGLKSPEAVNNMRTVGGADIVRQAAKARINEAFMAASNIEKSTIGGFPIGEKFAFDSTKFNSLLGLTKGGSNEAATLQAMLQGTGVTADTIRMIGRVGQTVANAPISDVSTFVARKAVLGGGGGGIEGALGAALGSTVAAGGGKSGIGGVVMKIIIARRGLEALMKPNAVLWATRATNTGLPQRARNAAALHLAKAVGLSAADVEATVRDQPAQ